MSAPNMNGSSTVLHNSSPQVTDPLRFLKACAQQGLCVLGLGMPAPVRLACVILATVRTLCGCRL